MTAFTTIAFGLCAYLAQGLPEHHKSMIFVGNINMGVCEPWIFFPDSHGERAIVNGHTYGADVNDSGAALYFDDKVFYFVKDSI